jgi:uncharacterized SAM-binding protein YcdF (DUF218 family)
MSWFLFLLVAAGTLVATWRTSRAVGVIAAIALAGLAVVFWPGRFFAEKMLTELALPLGAIWFALLVAAGWSYRKRRRGQSAAFLAVAAALSVAGNGDVADALVRSLEDRYRDIDPFAAGPLDAVCVLGGGLSIGPGKRIMANPSGDRVVLGARLYHEGVTRRLVCTGRIPSLDPSLPSLAEMAETLWRQLGVPGDAITALPGENTRDEMRELKRLGEERGWSRIGVVTSAWHMGRAERLAASVGFRFTPLPANFESSPDLDIDRWLWVRTYSVLPSPGATMTTHMAIKEYLARLVGR